MAGLVFGGFQQEDWRDRTSQSGKGGVPGSVQSSVGQLKKKKLEKRWGGSIEGRGPPVQIKKQKNKSVLGFFGIFSSPSRGGGARRRQDTPAAHSGEAGETPNTQHLNPHAHTEERAGRVT